MPPRNSPRGLVAAYSFEVVQESSGAVSTIDTNSTALTLTKGISLSGKTTGVISHNSTGRLVTNLGMKTGTNGQFYENTTGVYLKWKSTAKYITRNTTAN
jgi:hypothetical protein